MWKAWEIKRKQSRLCSSRLCTRFIICYFLFLLKLAVIYQTIHNRTKGKSNNISKLFSPPFGISSLSPPYPSSLLMHFPIKQTKNKSTKHHHSDDTGLPQAFHSWVPEAALCPAHTTEHKSEGSQVTGRLEPSPGYLPGVRPLLRPSFLKQYAAYISQNKFNAGRKFMLFRKK